MLVIMDSGSLFAEADKEIRKLGTGVMCTLIDILHAVEDDWKIFMFFIPKDPHNENAGRKYSSEDIRKIEYHARASQEPCAKIMFDEWGTSGQTRPTLRTVQQVALKADMMRLADAISIMLKEPLHRRPTLGPGAPVTTQLTQLLNEASSDMTTSPMRSEHNGPNIQGSTEQVYNIPNWEHFHDLNHTHNSGSVYNMPNWERLVRTYSQQISGSQEETTASSTMGPHQHNKNMQ